VISESRLARWVGVPVDRLRDIWRTSGLGEEYPQEYGREQLQALAMGVGDWVLQAKDEGPEEVREMATVIKLWGNSRLLQCKRDNGSLIDVIVRDNRDWIKLVNKPVPCWLRTVTADRQCWYVGCKDPVKGQLPPSFDRDAWLAGG
jgi:hypothetical protein